MVNAPLSGGVDGSLGDFAKFGVITVSDRASTGTYEDLSGPAILQFFAEAIESKWEAVYKLVPDEQAQIEAAIIDLVSCFRACLHNKQQHWACGSPTPPLTSAWSLSHGLPACLATWPA